MARVRKQWWEVPRPVQVMMVVALAAFAVYAVGAAVTTGGKTAPQAVSGNVGVPSLSSPTPTTATGKFAKLTPSHGRSKVVALVLGDSYTGGTGANPGRGYVDQLTQRFGWDTTVVSTSGGGYIAKGAKGPLTALATPGLLEKVQPDVILIQAGHNDASTGSSVGHAVNQVFQTIRGVTLAPIVTVGVFWPGADEPANASATDEAIRGEATTWKNVLWLDPLHQPWGHYPTIDDVHPNQAGHDQIAATIAKRMREAGLVG